VVVMAVDQLQTARRAAPALLLSGIHRRLLQAQAARLHRARLIPAHPLLLRSLAAAQALLYRLAQAAAHCLRRAALYPALARLLVRLLIHLLRAVARCLCRVHRAHRVLIALIRQAQVALRAQAARRQKVYGMTGINIRIFG